MEKLYEAGNGECFIPAKEEDETARRAEVIEEAAEEVMETLCTYGTAIWGDILAEVIKAVFTVKTDAEDIKREMEAKREIELPSGAIIALNAGAESAQACS